MQISVEWSLNLPFMFEMSLGIWHLPTITMPISPSYSKALNFSDCVKEMGKCLDEEQLELMLVVAWALSLWSDINLLLFQEEIMAAQERATISQVSRSVPAISISIKSHLDSCLSNF